MHELGVVIEVVKTIENIMAEQQLTKVEKIVLQIGELSSMIPKYIESCYPAAVENTSLQDTKLEIEVLPGNAICKECNQVFNIIKSDSTCPHCNSKSWELLGGKEFMIKEILAY